MPSDMHRHVFRDDAGDEFSFILPDWLAGTLRRRWAEQGIGDDDVQGGVERRSQTGTPARAW